MDELIYWIWLTTIEGVGIKTQHNLLKLFNSPREIYEADKAALIKAGISSKRCDAIMASKNLESANRIAEDCQRIGIGIITQKDSFYTSKQIQDDNLPILLYCKGDIKAEYLSLKRIGVIGARRCTQKDKEECIELIKEEASKGSNPIIVSGAAKGIDGYAHTAAIKNGLKTIAFVGSGLDVYYPREHKELIEQISLNGAVISQFPPGTPPLRYHFPMRNRLIAVWSDELKVFGAGKNSGTRYTVEYFNNAIKNNIKDSDKKDIEMHCIYADRVDKVQSVSYNLGEKLDTALYL